MKTVLYANTRLCDQPKGEDTDFPDFSLHGGRCRITNPTFWKEGCVTL
jgi:hypothetical protein